MDVPVVLGTYVAEWRVVWPPSEGFLGTYGIHADRSLSFFLLPNSLPTVAFYFNWGSYFFDGAQRSVSVMIQY